ncbi:MAG: hypothetical protein PHN39_02775 [Candidatus Pacebacteria bacterium]|nr:hypothetical protein [Candidatus Paceibacterota bacterium]
MSPTPNFDKALETILTKLQPHQKGCQQCRMVFDIFKEDIDFYQIFRVPSPTLCPQCRLQRRLGYRINLSPVFYKKGCSAPGHSEKVVSTYAPDNPLKIYDYNFWHSDQWEPFDFGRNYDFSKKFFEQFMDFVWGMPHPAIYKDPRGVNSEYVVSGLQPKNCYYSAVPYASENVYYSSLIMYSKDCVDCIYLDNCQQCYGSANLYRCHNCLFCVDCSECLDSLFSFNCKNCQHCFGCDNLRNKKYHFFNLPLTKEAYEQKLKNINLGDRTILLQYLQKFSHILSSAIHKNLNNLKIANSSGNDLRECNNCFWCFEIWGGCENLRYGASLEKVNNSMDFFGGSDNSFVYESTGISYCNNVKFCLQCRHSSNVEFCCECHNCEYCFGCFGLKNKKYCLFNRQYQEKDYWALVDEIKSRMLKDDEYGEFLPLNKAWVPYNDSSASVDFPLSQAEAKQKGRHFQEEVKSEIDLSKVQSIKAEDLPDDIAKVPDEILDKAIICATTHKPFKLTKFELDFYRKYNLSLPTEHPSERIKNRLRDFRHPYKLWKDTCFNCKKEINSGWDPAKEYKIYCEACYLREIV